MFQILVGQAYANTSHNNDFYVDTIFHSIEYFKA